MRGPTNKAWEEFVVWCQAKGLKAVPANPWTVAAYARSLEPRYRPATIRKHIADLARVHEEKTRRRLARDPLVQRTLGIIERRAEQVKQDAELFEDEDFLAARKPRKRPPKRKSKSAKKPPQSATKPARPGLSAQPRLVSRRKLN